MYLAFLCVITNQGKYYSREVRQILSTMQSTPSVVIGFMTLLCNYLCKMGYFRDELAVVLQIRTGIRDNFGIFIHIIP